MVTFELLRTLCTIFGTRLLAVLDALRIEYAAKHVVTHTGKVAYATATDKHNAVLLKVVAFAWDIGNNFALVRQANLRNLTQSRVRLFRGRCVNAGANAALLGILLHRRDLGLGLLRSPALADQLVNRWHIFTFIKRLLWMGSRILRWRLSLWPTRPITQCAAILSISRRPKRIIPPVTGMRAISAR